MSTGNEALAEAISYIGGDAMQVGPLWFYDCTSESDHRDWNVLFKIAMYLKRRSICPVLIIRQYAITIYQATWQSVAFRDVKNISRPLPTQHHLSHFFHILSPTATCTPSIVAWSPALRWEGLRVCYLNRYNKLQKNVSPLFSMSCDWL